ncbi:MAG TPA: amidohydrolase [Halieaceae bacterium]|nr:amidohydrolase [Halieaceae bacterium]
MGSDRHLVISSDCHAGLPAAKYREYMDPKYRDMFDIALPIQTEMTDMAEKVFLLKDVNDEWRSGIQEHLCGAWDYKKRIEVLNGDGIAGEVIFPDGITEQNAPPFGAGLQMPTKNVIAELQWAGARAHNRWLAEMVSNNPARHFGIAVCPILWDVEEGIKEVRWSAKNGLGGVLLPLLTNEYESYHNPKYDPFWEVCEDLNIVVCFHSGPAPMEDYYGQMFPMGDIEKYPGAVGIFISEVFFWTYRPLIFMAWGGVFERFPKLKASVTETGQGFLLPPMLRMLDHHYHDTHFSAKLGDYRSHLSMSPVDYFKRNCAIGASCMPRGDVEMRHQLGMDQLMWGSDYPHPEGTWPHTAKEVKEAFQGFPEDDVAAILGGNAAKFYNFDVDALAPIVAQVGPLKSEFV